MITKEQAMTLRHGTELHVGRCIVEVGPRGGRKERCARWRINGQCKTWKTRPSHFRIPIKNGLYLYGYLDHYNCLEFHLASECRPVEVQA